MEVLRNYNFNKVSCQEVVITLKDVNLKLGIKIRSGNDEVIVDFKHVMMETRGDHFRFGSVFT
jgi:hypothetical protein